MKTTLEISDELYRQAKVHAAQENRKMKDLVSEGLRLVLGMTKAPVAVRRRNRPAAPIQPETTEEERRHEESRRKALAIMEEIRRHPPYPPGGVREIIEEMNRSRKDGWSRSDGAE